MKKIIAEVSGKINLSLNILGRTNGLHIIDMVTVSVDCTDTVTVIFKDSNSVNIKFSDNSIPQNNTVLKAVNLIKELIDFGADIYIEKRLPIAGGMGGSSADAAGLISILDREFALSSKVDISMLAAKIGSDVPYMIDGGFCRIKNTGDLVLPIKCNPEIYFAVVYMPKGVSSLESYGRFDELYIDNTFCPADNEKLIDCLKAGKTQEAVAYMDNALTFASVSCLPGLNAVFEQFKALGLKGVMTGSGSCIFAVCKNQEHSSRVVSHFISLGYSSFGCRSTDKAVKIV